MDKHGWIVVYTGDFASIEPCINSCRDYFCLNECQCSTTFEEACAMVADHYQQQADQWRDGTHWRAEWWKQDQEDTE